MKFFIRKFKKSNEKKLCTKIMVHDVKLNFEFFNTKFSFLQNKCIQNTNRD
jgi:hypothetical protein